METSFEKRCEILGKFWADNRYDPDCFDLFDRNDLGFPMAFAISEKILEPSDKLTELVNETWKELLAEWETEDLGFEKWEDIGV
jgi:hypothetical protein